MSTYDVTTIGATGSVVDVRAMSEGEMLDRVRVAMDSEFVSEVRVTKTIETLLEPVNKPVEGKCDHNCAPTYTNMLPDAAHYLDCPVWAYNV